MNAPQSFGEWLRHRRRELDLTQEALARQVGCARVTIRKLEADEMRPSKQLAELLAEQLGIPPDERATFVRLGRSGLPVDTTAATTPHHNLPIQLSSFIGREREIAHIKALLSRNRLATLTGAGGSGKTRLAIQVTGELVETYEAGAWWIELASLLDASLVVRAVAKVLGVREASDRPLRETLALNLLSKSLLLVLDNCEHLIMTCAQLAEYLLSQCPQLKILATSREPLGIMGEAIFQVPTLSLPAPQPAASPDMLMKSEAIHLFVDRARSIKPDFVLNAQQAPFVVQICHQLDGMPLAIELATARLKILSVEQIALRLDDRFDLLTTGSRTALPRHQTLRATIDWSYDLLGEQERILFRRLSVFVGGFNLETAEAVCGDEQLNQSGVLNLLGQLVDKSLINVEAQAEAKQRPTRYRLLETIREYVREKLIESGEEHIVRDHHMEFFSQLAIDAEPKLLGAETIRWVNRLEAEHDNLLVAIDWSLKSENADFALRIVGALMQWDAWHNSEGAERSLQVVKSPLTSRRTSLRAKALNTAGVMQWFQGNLVQAHTLLEEAAEISQESSDKEGYIWVLANLGSVVAAEGDYETARAYLEEGLAEARKLPMGTFSMGWSFAHLGDICIFRGDREQARQRYEQAVACLRELNNRNFLAYPLRRLGELALDRAEYETAAALCRESLSLNIEQGDQRAVVASLAGFAAIAAARGQLVPAALLYSAVEFLRATISVTLLPTDQQAYDRNVAMLRSQLDEAVFAKARAEGYAMTLEQAIEFALQI